MFTNTGTGSGVKNGRYAPLPPENERTEPAPPPASESGVEADPDQSRAVAAFIAEFVLYVKHRRTYPPEHPLVVASLTRTLALLAPVMARQEELTVGVARQGLFVGESFLDRYNPRFTMLAEILTEHGIAAFTFARPTSAADLHSFTGLLEIHPDQLWQRGGVGEILAASGVSAIRVIGVTSGHFRLREETELPDEEGNGEDGFLWEAFFRSLGEEGLLDAGRAVSDAAAIARLLSEASASGIDLSGRLSAAQKRFVDGIPPQLTVANARSLEKILGFVTGLSPRLRKLFLMNLFGAPPDKAAFAEALATGLPNEAIMDALRSAATETYVPPLVQRLMSRLAAVSPDREEERVPLTGGTDARMRLLMQKDEIERYVPVEYRETLVSILAAEETPEEYAAEIAELRRRLETEGVERKTVELIFELDRTMPLDGMIEGMVGNLRELAGFFLETGDFTTLDRMVDQLRDISSLPSASGLASGLREFVASPAFTDPLFDSLELWGKEKRPEITALIGKIGPMIVPALLDRLAEEANMSLRRYYMDRLMELGTVARDAAIERLGDGRWFFVRNLIILLRAMNDPVGLGCIRALSTHPHPKIREEVLKSFRHCGDAVGEEVVLRELGADERERVLKGVRMAESSRSEAVMEKLLGIVAASRLASFDLELKKSAVKALAGIGNRRALPFLEEFLRSRNLFHPILHNRLKLDIVRSLDRYPEKEAGPLLERMARSPGEAAILAQQMLRERSGRRAA